MNAVAKMLTQALAQASALLAPSWPRRPWRLVILFLALALLSLLSGLAVGLAPRRLALAPCILFLFGLWQGFQQWRALERERATVDDWLRNGVSGRGQWRVEELASPKARRRWARSLQRLVDQAHEAGLSAAVIYRPIVRREREALLALARRLAQLERPVSPHGVVLLHDLFRDSFGPLYNSDRAEELGRRLKEIRAALEPVALAAA